MTALNKQALTDEAISQAFTGTNFGRDDLKNILSETVIDAAAGWRCGHTATTICAQLGLLTATGRASALGLRFVSEHVQRETKRLRDELEAAGRQNGYLREQRDEWERKAISNFEECSEMATRIEELESQRQMAFMATNRWSDKFREAEKRIAETNQRNTELTAKIEPMERRIAELEARTAVVKQFDEFQIVHYGCSEDYAKGYIDCQNNYNKSLAAAGIGVKGE